MEAEITSHCKLQHCNIVRLLDHFIINPNPGPGHGRLRILALELCNGDDLRTHLDASPCMDDGRLIALMTQMAAALGYMEQQCIVHRDIKPANIMIHDNGDGRVQFKLTDFGLARELQIEDTAATQLGTPCYMAPEIGGKRAMRLFYVSLL